MARANFLIDCTRIVNVSEAKKAAIICTLRRQTSREFTHAPSNLTTGRKNTASTIHNPGGAISTRGIETFLRSHEICYPHRVVFAKFANLVTVGYERAIPTVMRFGIHWHPEIGQNFPLLILPLNHPLKWTAKVSRKKERNIRPQMEFQSAMNKRTASLLVLVV